MSAKVDNITLALISLKAEIETYLNNNGWKNIYSIFLVNDPALKNSEIVLKKTQRNQIELPIIYIDPGSVRNNIEELGDEHGRDVVTLSMFISCKDTIQLITLSNLVRRKLNYLVFNILDYTGPKTNLGSAEIRQVEFIDLSNQNSDNIAQQYYGMINMLLELNAESLL